MCGVQMLVKEVERCLAANGGVVSAQQLLEAGMTTSELRRLNWRQPRRGWYACPTAETKVEQAVHGGGVVACLTVLRRHKIWVPPDASGVHIRYPRKKKCQPYGSHPPARTAIDSLETALASAVSCLDPEGVVVILDSALNKGLIEMADATTLVKGSRYAHLRLDEKCDSRSESGLETMTRLRLRSRKIGLRVQVPIGDIGIVDLLVGKSLVIECDGYEFHREKFEEDRERDRMLEALGFTVVRLTYRQVMHDWKAVEQDLLAIVRRGDHLISAAIRT